MAGTHMLAEWNATRSHDDTEIGKSAEPLSYAFQAVREASRGIDVILADAAE